MSASPQKADIAETIVGAESVQAHVIIRVGGIMAASVPLTMRSDDEIVRRGRDHYRSVRFRNILVHVCNMPLAHDEAWRDEIDHGEFTKVLQRMNRFNFFAAGLMGVTALLAALARYLG